MRRALAILSFTTLFTLPVTAQDCGEGERLFAHEGGETCIPENPERIIGLHDQSVTLSLLELGAPVVGSHGRVNDDDGLYMRAVDLLMGLDFENSGIAYVGGFNTMDYETMAALEPDLIIGRSYDLEARAQYEAIAPTVFISEDPEDQLHFSRDIADAVGARDKWERMNATYEANIARAKAAFPAAQDATYAKIQMSSEGFTLYAGYGGLTMVLEDLGFERIDYAKDMVERGIVWGETVSFELLPQFQADYLFDTYTIAYGDTLADPRARFDAAFPAWCDVLEACAGGRYIVLPREMSTGFSFTQLDMLIHLITTHAARNPA